MIPFLIVLFCAVFAFSVSTIALNGDPSNINIYEAMQLNYRIVFGDFFTDQYNNDAAQWILFILASGLLSLIMLNMLVALMSDTYARVMSDIIPKDFCELTNMILEQEEILFWKWKSGSPQYLHFAQYLEKQEKEQWEGSAGGKMKNKKMDDSGRIESLEQKVEMLLDVITVL